MSEKIFGATEIKTDDGTKILYECARCGFKTFDRMEVHSVFTHFVCCNCLGHKFKDCIGKVG